MEETMPGGRGGVVQRRKAAVREDLAHGAVLVLAVDQRCDAVGILDGSSILRDGALVAVQIFFQGGKVIDGGIILGQLAQQFTHRDHALGVEEALVVPTLVLSATALV